MNLEEHTILVNGHQIYFKKIGKGEPLILIHGLSGSTRWWKKNIRALAKNYEIFLLDLPGYGTMRHPQKRLALKDASNWLYEWMKALKIKKARFIGHSMGGYICLKLALTHPDIVYCLVLVSPAGIMLPRSLFKYIIGLLHATRYLSLSFVPILFFDVLAAGPITIMRSALEMIKEELGTDIHHFTIPTFLIWGKNDTLVPPETGSLLAKLIPGSQLQIIERAGHVPMFDQPEKFNTIVLTFLAKNKA